MSISKVILVFFGAGIGGMLRYMTGHLFKIQSSVFPYSTLLVNVLGCFMIGLLFYYLSAEKNDLRLFAIVGLLGGFTTFSSFGIEFYYLVQNGKVQMAVIYASLSNICGILAVYLGAKLAHII